MHQVLDAAERSFVSLTGYAGFDRDLSEEILAVVLKSVSEEQDDCARQVAAYAEATRERLGQLYGKYGPGGKFADESRCYLTHQPASIVVCERLDTVPMWLTSVEQRDRCRDRPGALHSVLAVRPVTLVSGTGDRRGGGRRLGGDFEQRARPWPS
ncbi:hypothetical protein ACH4D3_40695 [Streptomyces sp. NPDC018026]|uniref:hypothetical protein n=1 Tax=Streptomyces sp. NPDC018026 TaxID=3365031 RepID=UPI0037BCC72E